MANDYTPFLEDVAALINAVKADISDEYRAFDGDDTPGIQLTVAVNTYEQIADADYTWQTGDNSYTGGAYSRRHWAVTGIYRDTSAAETAQELLDQLLDLTYQDTVSF